MFSDTRSKRIILVSHCILNQNSISDGTADYPGTNEVIMKQLLQSNVGIIQMPCPEILCLGLDRRDIHGGERPVVVENTRIRQELKKEDSIKIINNFVEQIVFQIEEYIRNGFTVLGIVGINRSPSCGVNTTSENNQEIAGEGIFIKILREALEKKQIYINMVGIKGLEMDKAFILIQELLDR
ncbi:Predicted secreted protein [Anaerovirgula multivorans]|uniref:Predicted secreted protein n=1 Tax=Anaerovirgula multivorans TaxID=312168 RepID=A0A239BBT1_9FIRM|nr:CD3072 family TudS-related putative desulfidase [Anaerovirgula multivorans]SNS05417.1 Predicted secreted protein [Anaerovirgula multivorans]